MKQCAHCKEWKAEEEFAFSNKALQIRQKHCRVCMRQFNKDSYDRRSEVYRENIYKNRSVRRGVAKEYVWNYLLAHPCTECGESDPRLLEFHHLDATTKEYNVSELVNGRYSLERIQQEINKCVVLCANCHRRKTFEEMGWYSR